MSALGVNENILEAKAKQPNKNNRKKKKSLPLLLQVND